MEQPESAKDWSPRGEPPLYRLIALKQRLEIGSDLEDLVFRGFLHSEECRKRGFNYELCWHNCNPNGFEEGIEVADLLTTLGL